MALKLAGVMMGNLSGPPTTLTLEDLSDVFVTTPLTGQYLRYNSAVTGWENSSLNADVYGYLKTNLTGSNGVTVTDTDVTSSVDISLSLTASGDATGSVTSGDLALTLATVNSAPQTDTFRKITVNDKGLVTATSAVSSSDITTALGYTPAHAGANTDITSLTGITGLVQTATGIDFNTTTPAADGVGRLNWNTTDGTLNLGLVGGNVSLQLGQEQLVRVLNNSGSPMTEGQVVYINGASGNRPTVRLAQANSEATSQGTLGILTENIANNAQGFCTVSGIVHTINTSAFNDGDLIFLSPTVAGGYTVTEPTAPNHRVVLGYVIRAHATLGQIFVEVDTGLELAELHDVLITSPTNGQLLTYNSSTGIWVNSSPATNGTVTSVSVTSANGVSGTVATSTTTPAITLSLGAITPTSVAATGTVTGSNLSGTNTGDQTITLTGDVTGSGTGSFATTLATVNASPQTDTFRKVTVNGKGLVTATSAVSASDITTALTYTPVNKNGDTMTGLLILSGDPVNALGAVTKQYADAISSGVNIKSACRAATTAALTATYNNGTSGVGATLTGTGAMPTVGGVTLAVNDRVLVKNQATQTQNGIYVVTQITSNWIMTRASDFDGSPTQEIIAGDLTYIQEGTLNGTQWVQITTGTITVGSSNIVFTQFAGTGIYTQGTGISISNNVISIDSTVATLSGSQALTNKTYEGLTITATTGGTLTVANSKTLTVSNTLTLQGTDGSTLNIGTGGTLGSAAYTASTAYQAALAQGVMTSATAASATAIAVDTFSTTTYRSAKYLIQVSNGTPTYQVSELLLIHDGTTVYVTEYGTISSGAVIATFDAAIAATTLTLTMTPVTGTCTAKVIRTSVVV